VIRVRDTGVGISVELLDHTFELFTQADQGLARSRGGLGIGLYLARNLVTLHGGTIEARSDGVGQGSEFIVRLPVSCPAPQTSEPTASAGPRNPSRTAQVARNGRRLLILDDNIDAARSLELYLSRAGYEVRLAHEGTPLSRWSGTSNRTWPFWTSVYPTWTAPRSLGKCDRESPLR
jgi:hypothetical protein